jgi:hypothetical protein
MTLADIQDAQYFSNLKLCLSQEIIDKAMPQLQPVDPTAPIPTGLLRNPHGSVSWVKTPSNGIKPVWNEPSSILFLSVFPAPSERAMTYQDYLNSVQSQ